MVQGPPQPRALAPLAPLVAQPRGASQRGITGDPAVGPLSPPRVKPLQTLLRPRVLPPLQRHVAFLAPWLVPWPLLRQGPTEVEQGLVWRRDVAHEAAPLAGGDLTPVAAPVPLPPHRMCAALGKAARIAGADAIGCTHRLAPRSDPHLEQRAMVPGGGATEGWQDLSLHLDHSGALRGLLAVHVGQQPLERAGNRAPAALGLSSVWVRHDQSAPAVPQRVESVGGNEAVPPSCFFPLCPRRGPLFAS